LVLAHCGDGQLLRFTTMHEAHALTPHKSGAARARRFDPQVAF